MCTLLLQPVRPLPIFSNIAIDSTAMALHCGQNSLKLIQTVQTCNLIELSMRMAVIMQNDMCHQHSMHPIEKYSNFLSC